MVAQIVSFFQRTPRFSPTPADWSQQELAEFYRVENALIRAGIRVGTDRGLSDENEPWFIFYRADDGEVVIHFARIDGEYLIAGPAYEEIARGYDFSALVRNMIARHPLVRRSHQNDNVSIHPAALLIAVVGTAFFKTGEARAAETKEGAPSRPALLFGSSAPIAVQAAAPQHIDSVQIPANQAVLILAAALLASNYSVEAASIDAATRAALKATAAALDFSGVSHTPIGPAPEAVGPGATHAVTPDASAAQHMSSVLSLVAMLSTMPQDHILAESVAPQETALTQAALRHDPIFNAVPAPSDDHGWAIDVRLSAGALPSVEAIQLVRGYLGEAGYGKISVIEVTKLPEVLADLINRGEHVFTPVTPDTTTTPPITPEPVTPTTPDASGGGGGNGSGGNGGSGDGGDGGHTGYTPLPIEPTPQPTAFATTEMVKQFIDYFISHTSDVTVMQNGPSIVMFDSRVLHHVETIVHLTSLTFDFADGGSISLVGDSSSFLNNHFLT